MVAEISRYRKHVGWYLFVPFFPIVMIACATIQDEAGNGNLKSVQEYLSGGGNVNAKEDGMRTILEAAVSGGNIEIVKLLVEKGADVNLEGYRTPLIAAVANKRYEILRYLVENGADLNRSYLKNDGPAQRPEFKEEMSPLMFASNYHDVEAIKLLIQMGADRALANHLGIQSWMYFIRSSGEAPLDTAIVAMLTDKGKLLEENVSYIFCMRGIEVTHIDRQLTPGQEIINKISNNEKITIKQYRYLIMPYLELSAGNHLIGFSYFEEIYFGSTKTSVTGKNVNAEMILLSKGIYRVHADVQGSTWSPVVEKVF